MESGDESVAPMLKKSVNTDTDGGTDYNEDDAASPGT
jgi:hypothetical protein